jgi:hypothetical protein
MCRSLGDVGEKVKAERRVHEWGADQRRVLVAADTEMRARNAQASEPRDREHHFSKLYLPHKGMFCELPHDLQLGTRLPVRGSCVLSPAPAALQPLHPVHHVA